MWKDPIVKKRPNPYNEGENGGDFLFLEGRGWGKKRAVLKTEEKLGTGIKPEWNIPRRHNFFVGKKVMGDFLWALRTLIFSHHFPVVLFHIIIASSSSTYLLPDSKIYCSHKV